MSRHAFHANESLLLHQRKLTREEEIAAWEAGDIDTLACSQLAYVVRICMDACRLFHQRIEFDDVVAVGLRTMVLSLKSYDAREGRLTTWITRTVRWKVFDEIGSQICGINPHRKGVKKMNASVKLVKDEFLANKPDEASDIELVDNEDELSDWREKVSLAIDKSLSEREREVISRMMAGETMADIGRDVGLGRSRIQQIAKSSVAKLRSAIESGDVPELVEVPA